MRETNRLLLLRYTLSHKRQPNRSHAMKSGSLSLAGTEDISIDDPSRKIHNAHDNAKLKLGLFFVIVKRKQKMAPGFIFALIYSLKMIIP